MGYIALKKIEELINKKIKGDALIQACDQFYTRIPHDFGVCVMCVCVCVLCDVCVCVWWCVLCDVCDVCVQGGWGYSRAVLTVCACGWGQELSCPAPWHYASQ